MQSLKAFPEGNELETKSMLYNFDFVVIKQFWKYHGHMYVRIFTTFSE